MPAYSSAGRRKTANNSATGATGSSGSTGSQGVQGEFPKWNKHFAWIMSAPNQSAAGSDTNRLIHGFTTPATEAGNAISTVVDARNAWRRFTTLNTTGSNARVSTSAGVAYVPHGVYCSWRVRMGSVITVMRFFAVTSGGQPDDADTQTTTGRVTIGFRYSTVASDTGFVPFVWDSTAQTTGAALSTVATSTEYYLECVIAASGGITSADFYVTKAGVARAGPTNIVIVDANVQPTTLGNRIGPSVDIYTRENVAKTVDVAGMWQNSGLSPFERAV